MLEICHLLHTFFVKYKNVFYSKFNQFGLDYIVFFSSCIQKISLQEVLVRTHN